MGEQLSAAIGFAQFDTARAAEIGARLLTGNLSEARIKMLFTALLQRRDGPAALTKALAVQKPARDSSRLALRHLQAIGRQDKELIAVLTEAAVRNHVLQMRGIDSTLEFVERQAQAMKTRDD